MPDLLTHYVSSFLVSRPFFKTREALLISFAGLLPDLDALLRVHRWFTHSLPISYVFWIPVFLGILLYDKKYLKYAAMGLSLYTLHVFLDLFCGYTPILWPFYPAIWLNIGLDGIFSQNGISFSSSFKALTQSPDFSQRSVVEGPIISETGVIIFTIAILVIVAENLGRRKMRKIEWM